MNKEYSTDLQKLFLEIMVHDPQSFVRVRNIYNVENFDRSLRSAGQFILDHADNHSTMPSLQQINATTGSKLQPVEQLDDGQLDWFLQEFEGFTKRAELERAILKSADLLEEGNYDPVEKMIKDAVQISLQKDLGTEYFEDPKARLLRIKENNGQMSTGWPALDKKLYGGFNRGELQVFAGGSGSGKSLFMQNLAVNWVTTSLHGVYLTLELSEELCAMRIDSMITDMPSRDILKSVDDVEIKVKIAGKKAGKLYLKYMSAQSTINDVRAYIKELHIQTGVKPDFLCVDYLDLLMPSTVKVAPTDQFVKDKYVAEELRNLAKELDLMLVTASQLNRSAVEEVELDHSHIAGGISKINTADNVFAIYTSRAMRERGRYQLQLIKTRSSSGVGSKVDLEFDIDSLRIKDLAEDDEHQEFQKRSSTIYDKIKATSSVSTGETSSGSLGADESGKISADVKSSKLKGMLANLKTNQED